MVGSAQRRMANGILQHGSILLVDQQYILKKLFTGNDDVIHGSLNDLTVEDNELAVDHQAQGKIIDALLRGFESELGCCWEKEIDLSYFFTHEAQLKKRYSIYRAHFYAHLLKR